jgi:hypothetical protein
VGFTERSKEIFQTSYLLLLAFNFNNANFYTHAPARCRAHSELAADDQCYDHVRTVLVFHIRNCKQWVWLTGGMTKWLGKTQVQWSMWYPELYDPRKLYWPATDTHYIASFHQLAAMLWKWWLEENFGVSFFRLYIHTPYCANSDEKGTEHATRKTKHDNK